MRTRENKDGEENCERMRGDGNYEQESKNVCRYKNVTVRMRKTKMERSMRIAKK